MSNRRRHLLIALFGLAPIPAHAHGVPVWMFIAALSPLLVLVFVAVYGWLARAPRAAIVHAFLQAIWVVWFWSASNHNEVLLFGISTDYVIWVAFGLYVGHTLVILALVVIHGARRLAAAAQPTVEADGPASGGPAA